MIPAKKAAAVWLLVDNGSLHAASTLALRRVAAQLSQRLGEPVHPVSVLHSGKVSAGELEGRCAETLVGALRRRLRLGVRGFRVLPFFIGPSRALTQYLPDKFEASRRENSGWEAATLAIAPPLCDLDGSPGDTRLAEALRDRVAETVRARGWACPAVALTDHGSPEPAVTQTRDHLGVQLEALLGRGCRAFTVASMERRAGPEYDFNEPLLERALRTPAFAEGPVVVAQLFLSPGRHAGRGGDIAQIATLAEAQHAALRVAPTPTLGEHPLVLDILTERAAALGRAG